MNVADMRKDYTQHGLLEGEAAAEPFAQFTAWFDQAVAGNVHEPNAMTVATVDPDGRPSARIVLLKGYDARGFGFYPYYERRKGRALEAAGLPLCDHLRWLDLGNPAQNVADVQALFA
ncbi:MAG: pyridoxamine 5'-phosphate oxidase family protein, partial [Roseiflexaceae bacterium]